MDFQDGGQWTDGHTFTQQLRLRVRGEEARDVGARRAAEVLQEDRGEKKSC